jgi:hypothetical protein
MCGGGPGRALVARWLARGLLALALLGAPAARAAAPAAPSKEYQLKAVFLFNFAQFVDWPARAYKDAQSPCVIGVLGDDPFGAYLDNLVRGERSSTKHPIVVQRYRRVEDIGDCHVLFICGSEAGRMDAILAGLKGRSILTVGDVDDFTRLGGIVRFVIEQGKIRLRINVEAARAADITISSYVLRLATIVTAADP